MNILIVEVTSLLLIRFYRRDLLQIARHNVTPGQDGGDRSPSASLSCKYHVNKFVTIYCIFSVVIVKSVPHSFVTLNLVVYYSFHRDQSQVKYTVHIHNLSGFYNPLKRKQ